MIRPRFVVIGLLLAFTANAAALSQTAVTLAYQYRIGNRSTYRSEEKSTIEQKIGADPSRIVTQRTTNSEVLRTIQSVVKNTAQVENINTRGTTKTVSIAGNTEYVVKDSLLRYTLNAQGGVIKFERPIVEGVQDGKASLFDGFALPLAAKAVKPGDSWSSTVMAAGFDGKPIPVKVKSMLRGKTKRAGKPCWQVESSFQAEIPIVGPTPAKAALTGGAVAYVVPEKGLDLETLVDITITMNSKPESLQGKELTTITKISSITKFVK